MGSATHAADRCRGLPSVMAITRSRPVWRRLAPAGLDQGGPGCVRSARVRPVRAVLGRVGLIALGLGAVSGCLGDPPPDPAEAPIEVVVEKCDLNRESVAAGTHEVTVVGTGVVVVTGPGDSPQVLRLEGPTGQPGTWTVSQPGSYRVTCETGVERTATLTVTG